MPWIAPPADRTEPPPTGEERSALEGWLDYHRATLQQKCTGLTDEQLKQRAVPPSGLSLLGLVRHLADVERSWFRQRMDGQKLADLYGTDEHPDADFEGVDAADAASDLATLGREVERARATAATHHLDDTFAHPRTGTVYTLRWVYLHMIEEYARHNGHADLLRERIDGVTGD
ncbi:MAG: hypothetical protein QOG60_9 [Frankiaceae bacterium]|nr:hypothetical protein [Frankiaceae bacterium]